MSESIKIKYIAPLRGARGQSEDGLPYLGLENIESGTGKIIELETPIVSDGITSYYQKNDVLFGKLRPYLAKVVLAKGEGVCTGELLVLNPKKEKVDPAFLAYRLRADDFIKAVNNSTYGSKMPRANWTFIGNQKIDLRSLAEQIAAVKELDNDSESITKLIEKKRLLIKKLKERRASIIHHAVTRGLDENVELVESGIAWIGRIPKNWKINRAKTFIKTRTAGVWGEEPDGGKNDLPCLRVADFDYEHMGHQRVSTIRSIESSQQWRVLPKHSILVERSGGGEKQPVGRAIYFNGNERMVCANFIDVITTKTHIYPKYFAYLLYDAYSIGISRKYIRQSTGIQNLNISGYLNELFVEPPYETQRKIVERLDCLISAIDLAVEKIVKSIDLLLEYRASLIVQITTSTR